MMFYYRLRDNICQKGVLNQKFIWEKKEKETTHEQTNNTKRFTLR